MLVYGVGFCIVLLCMYMFIFQENQQQKATDPYLSGLSELAAQVCGRIKLHQCSAVLPKGFFHPTATFDV